MGYKFSRVSKNHLSECHVDLQIIFCRVIEIYDCKVIEGYRDSTQQNILFEKGMSQLKWPSSSHNKKPSMAIDVLPYPIDWADKERFHYFAGIVKGMTHMLLKEKVITRNIRWGGDWDSDNDFKDQNFYDLPHFELIKV